MLASIKRQTISTATIIAQLSTHLTCCHSGTFLIATNDNRSCRILLKAGRVTHCSFGREHGDIALQRLAEIESGNYSFTKDVRLPFKERSEIKDKHAIDYLMTVLQQHTEKPNRSRLSGLTDQQMEGLFGKFHFE